MANFQFDSFTDFLSMGGDAAFVWSSYFFFLLFIFWNLLQPGLERRKIYRLLKARMQRENRIKQQQTQHLKATQAE